jgi:hypothetical protein
MLRLKMSRRDTASATITTFYFPGRFSNDPTYYSRIRSKIKTQSEVFTPLKIFYMVY